MGRPLLLVFVLAVIIASFSSRAQEEEENEEGDSFDNPHDYHKDTKQKCYERLLQHSPFADSTKYSSTGAWDTVFVGGSLTKDWTRKCRSLNEGKQVLSEHLQYCLPAEGRNYLQNDVEIVTEVLKGYMEPQELSTVLSLTAAPPSSSTKSQKNQEQEEEDRKERTYRRYLLSKLNVVVEAGLCQESVDGGVTVKHHPYFRVSKEPLSSKRTVRRSEEQEDVFSTVEQVEDEEVEEDKSE